MRETGERGAGGATLAAVTVCNACEELLGRVDDAWPGGDADRALERLRTRIDALPGRGAAPAPPAPAAGPVLEVDCLGHTRVAAGGIAIAMPRRSRLVLQYLVAHGPAPVPRDVLIEAFWPGSSPSAARNSLNVAVTLLRRALRPAYGDAPVVVFGDEAYRIAPPVRLDRDRFERLAREGLARHRAGDHAAAVPTLRAARDLHRGPLFAEEPYEDWIVTLRRAVEGARLEAMTALGESLVALGELGDGIAELQRVLADEPVREDVHRALMRAFVAQGRPYLALRQFEECAEGLRRRLGVAPSPETWDLRGRIAAASASRKREVVVA